MAFPKLALPLLLLSMAAAAQPPLPALRIEPTGGGSIFYIHNGASQPVTAFLIELVNYPGSSYSLWQDELADPIPAGGDRRLQVANMTVGAVPDYVKMQAALFADGTSAGIPEKAAQIVARRRAVLEATREAVRRCEKGPDKPAVVSALREWSGSLPQIPRSQRNSQSAIDQAAVRSVITETIAALNAKSLEEVLAALRSEEKRLSESKPQL